MAFTKALWERIGGFPEQVLVGEDTLFDFEARRQTKPAFIANAKAHYCPRNTFRSACHQMARYAVSDGKARVRWSRLFRNAARCVLEVLALASLRWSLCSACLVVLALEAWYAFHRDWRYLVRFGQGGAGAICIFRRRALGGGRKPDSRTVLRSSRMTNRQKRGRGTTGTQGT